MKDTPKTDIQQLTAHFFRHEYSKMVAVITRYFSLSNINLAEDIVQDTLLDAIKTWEYKGVPEKPTAWLYTVARNKALNVLHRDKYQQLYADEARFTQLEESLEQPIEVLFSADQINDDLLQMMFACCHPAISASSQIALILKTLCGFDIAEISSAFVTNRETINKRLVRARKALRENKIHFELPPQAELENRLETVLQTIYLLFNEGYKASKGNALIRLELCQEAVRLARLIVNSKLFTQTSRAHALLALMLLNISRFESRQDDAGNMIEMAKQDRSRWHQLLINEGLFYLEKMKENQEVSLYHILAAISAYHCTAPEYESTNWQGILSLYDALLTFEASPIIQLNRTIAFGKVHGNEAAISALLALASTESLNNYSPLYSTLATLYMETADYHQAKRHLLKAIDLTQQPSERHILTDKLATCKKFL